MSINNEVKLRRNRSRNSSNNISKRYKTNYKNYRRMMAAVLCIIVMVCATPVEASPTELSENELYAKSAVLMDADSGRILYNKNGDVAMANASTTKIMTCILALEMCDMNSVVTVSARACSAPKVRLGMHEGQQFYIRDLLYGLMLESFNDCAVAIAEHIAGTVEDFAKIMNSKAEEIGCVDTYFITPNGLDATDTIGFHHTTASDLALIMRYCIKQSEKTEQFLDITQTLNYSFRELQNGASYFCTNHNAFLQMMAGALTGKTGFTGNAGYCYVGALESEGRTYIIALLACGWPNNKTYKWSDAKKLFNYGKENFELHSTDEVKQHQQVEGADEEKTGIIEKYEIPTEVKVINGQTEKIGGIATAKLEVKNQMQTSKILMNKNEAWEIEMKCKRQVDAPVEEGMKVGYITYKLDGKEYYKDVIYVDETVDEIDFGWCLERVIKESLL